MKIYGPYYRKDGRAHIIHYDESTGKRRTQSYPRYLMEQYLGCELLSTEQVDHINNDPTDNRIENFQLLTHLKNNQKSNTKNRRIKLKCKFCGKTFFRKYSSYKGNKTQEKDVGYCSKQCVGKVYH